MNKKTTKNDIKSMLLKRQQENATNTIKLEDVDVVLRYAYQEGWDSDEESRRQAIEYLEADFDISYDQAEDLHDERIHFCGIILEDDCND